MYKLFLLLLVVTLTACAETETTDPVTAPVSESKVKTIERPPLASGIYQQLSGSEFKARLSEAREPQIVDVRTPEEYVTGHIPGAIQIDYTKDSFRDIVNALDKDRPVYVYCQKGGRSERACSQMLGDGFEEVYELKGGFGEWRGSIVIEE